MHRASFCLTILGKKIPEIGKIEAYTNAKIVTWYTRKKLKQTNKLAMGLNQQGNALSTKPCDQFDPGDLHGIRRELTPESYCLASTCIHAVACVCVHTHNK